MRHVQKIAGAKRWMALTPCSPTYVPSCWSMLWVRGWHLKLKIPMPNFHPLLHQQGVDQPIRHRLPPLFEASFITFWLLSWFLLKGPWFVLGVFFPRVSNSYKFLYMVRTYHIIFFKNEHVKLDETY